MPIQIPIGIDIQTLIGILTLIGETLTTGTGNMMIGYEILTEDLLLLMSPSGE